MNLAVATLVLALLGLPTPHCFGEVFLKGVSWRVSEPGRQRPRRHKEVTHWSKSPLEKADNPPSAVVILYNDGSKQAVGLVIRYAVSAKLAPLSKPPAANSAASSAKEDRWLVPFWLEQRHVPVVGPHQEKEVALNRLELVSFLKKVKRAGFWPEALRVQVMLEPKAGDDLEGIFLESVLPLKW